MDQATGKLVATKEESGDVDLSESENDSEGDVTGKFLAFFKKTRLRRKTYATSDSACQRSPKVEKIEWSHNQHVSPATVQQTETIFSIVKGI